MSLVEHIIEVFLYNECIRSITNKKSAGSYIALKVIHCVTKCETLMEALFMKGECHSLFTKD